MNIRRPINLVAGLLLMVCGAVIFLVLDRAGAELWESGGVAATALALGLTLLVTGLESSDRPDAEIEAVVDATSRVGVTITVDSDRTVKNIVIREKASNGRRVPPSWTTFHEGALISGRETTFYFDLPPGAADQTLHVEARVGGVKKPLSTQARRISGALHVEQPPAG
jgi:hypothetical protein